MQCPLCSLELVMSERQGIEIDYCPKCRGVWLDRGELDKIIEKSVKSSPAMKPEEARHAPEQNHHREVHNKYHHGHKKKNHSSKNCLINRFLGEAETCDMGIETDLPVPAVDGKITLGTWQELILIDFDKRPRKRNIVERWSGLFGQAEAIYK